MCVLIYLALIGLFIFYSDFVLDQYALSAASGEGNWMIIAQSWELLPHLWPALVMAMLVSSAVTLFVARRLWKRA